MEGDKGSSESEKGKSESEKMGEVISAASPLLPPPINVGKHLREKKMDFQLPYDIWWLKQRKLVSVSGFLS